MSVCLCLSLYLSRGYNTTEDAADRGRGRGRGRGRDTLEMEKIKSERGEGEIISSSRQDGI